MENNNRDISHVREDLTLILTYFRSCLTFTSYVPIIREQVRDIREQGIEFHTCLQKSIKQSGNLEINAESAIKCLEKLDVPNFDANHVSDALNILSESARQNKDETKKLEEKFDSIRNKLGEINDKYYEREMNDKKKLFSLKERKEDLEDNSKNQLRMIVCFSIVGLVKIILSAIAHDQGFRVFLTIGITIMVILATTVFYYRNKTKTDLRKIKREIGYLEETENLIKSSKIELTKIYNRIDSIIIQIGYFNTYWGSQYNLLEELNSNLDGVSDQGRRVFMAPMKSRWEELKKLCNNFTMTIRKTVADVNNENAGEVVRNENMKENIHNENMRRNGSTKDDVRNGNTKDDVRNGSTKDDVRNGSTKDDVHNGSTKDDVRNGSMKEDVRSESTKEDVRGESTKENVRSEITKEDVRNESMKKGVRNESTKEDIHSEDIRSESIKMFESESMKKDIRSESMKEDVLNESMKENVRDESTKEDVRSESMKMFESESMKENVRDESTKEDVRSEDVCSEDARSESMKEDVRSESMKMFESECMKEEIRSESMKENVRDESTKEDVHSEDVCSKDARTDDVCSEDVRSEDVYVRTEDVCSEDVRSEDVYVRTEDVCSEDARSESMKEDFHNENVTKKN